MLNSEKIAIAAHLHVLLRRKTGRVTDTEWMASNAKLCALPAPVRKATATWTWANGPTSWSPRWPAPPW